MYDVGVMMGKYLPPHRGHLSAIFNASTQCKKLYVVVSDHPVVTKKLCESNNLPYISGVTRVTWLSQELQGFPHIEVVLLNEVSIPEYPNGWSEWIELLKLTVPEKFDVIFGGELDYVNKLRYFLPDVEYKLFDIDRTKFPISATQIRANIYQHWDYILGSARGFLSKRILIAGTESCGKTTLTKYLAKIFYTSWSEETGRYYAEKYLGGNENVYQMEDFELIAYEQYMADKDALSKANKVVFFDTDALITQYYAKLYIGQESPIVANFINPNKYDVVFLLLPDVEWVDDGQRFNGETEKRWKLHQELKDMYVNAGFGDKIIEIDGDYHQRLETAVELVNTMIKI